MLTARDMLDRLLYKLGYIRNNEHHKTLSTFLAMDNDLSRLVTASLRGDTVVSEKTPGALTFKWMIDPLKGGATKIAALMSESNSLLEDLKKHGVRNCSTGRTITEPLEYEGEKEKQMTKISVWATMILVFMAIIAWDVWLYLDGVPGNSISQVIISGAEDYPIVAWAVGFLMGFLTAHWFDPKAQEKP